ncbi:MAG TPA: cupredoxin family copper-binding protein [Pseudolabrys sp.]|nr:cupredoxin family copper-binding protein [Pseudolabrys sp.]
MPRLLPVAVAVIAGLLTASAHAATIRITIKDLVYSPAAAQAKVGDTVEWINKDVIAHTATARNGDWDVMIPANKTARLVVKKAGAVDYYCRFHPNMTARLTVAR